MAGITIPIATDTRQAVKGTDALADGFNKVADAIDDTADDSEKAGDRIERAMRDAQRETRDTAREFEKAGRKAKDVGDDAKQGFGHASETVAEFKDEARQNFSEVVSSFDGSMDSVADLAQGTLGGLAGSIAGPVGLAAGVGAAVLGGMFTAMTTSAQENAEKTQQRISDMVDDMIDSGERFASESLIQDTMKEIVKDSGQLDEVKRKADIAGVSMQTALRAQAGDKDAISTAIQNAQLSLDGLIQSGHSMSDYQVRETQKVIDNYKAMQGDITTAAGRADLLTQAMTNTAGAASAATGKAAGLKGALDGFHDVNVKVNFDDAAAREHLRQLGKAINVDLFVTPRTGRGVN